MLWVVTFSVFFPSLTRSSAVCVNPRPANIPMIIPNSQLFLMIGHSCLKFTNCFDDCRKARPTGPGDFHNYMGTEATWRDETNPTQSGAGWMHAPREPCPP